MAEPLCDAARHEVYASAFCLIIRAFVGRINFMTTIPTTLLAALEATTMLEIDGLHAWDFSLADELNIECMDGRERKVWRFSKAQVEAATFDESLQSWVVNDGNADHRIICLDAFTPSDEDDSGED
ncbi:hypothetical protein ALQ28_04309 [Pseudomonas syringae pv. delphinii]|uniref:DUF5629 domain-containing protein n=4 Tax=Pseudomonas syringae group genomosp. 3 TaxID=251701 RepID=A0A3M4B9X9_9PSED|nr:hypothetical protein ALQ28_04309 [Pseudomonas syringae pv. delphinii]